MALIDTLIGRRAQHLLAAVLLNPDRWWFFNELSREAGSAKGANQKIINGLVQGGLLLDDRRGSHRMLKANTSHPLYPELRAIAVKSFGLGAFVQRALAPYRGRIATAFIFGSVAKGTDTATSDVDLMVIGDMGLLEVYEALGDLHERVGRPIVAQVHTTAEWAQLIGRDPVIRAIDAGPKIEVTPDANG